MTSQLNVDTIVDKAGSGGTNVKIANTSVTVAEGGSATTNTVQGLAKVWVNYTMANTSAIFDSLNIATITDGGTGDGRFTFTSNMSNDDFAQVDGTGDNGTQFNNSRALGQSGNSTKTTSATRLDTGGQTVNAHYDHSDNTILIHGDLA